MTDYQSCGECHQLLFIIPECPCCVYKVYKKGESKKAAHIKAATHKDAAKKFSWRFIDGDAYDDGDSFEIVCINFKKEKKFFVFNVEKVVKIEFDGENEE